MRSGHIPSDKSIQNTMENHNKRVPGFENVAIGMQYETGTQSVKKDFQKAAYYYEKAVLENNQMGMLFLAILYYRGKGVNQDAERAAKLFERLAAIPIKPG